MRRFRPCAVVAASFLSVVLAASWCAAAALAQAPSGLEKTQQEVLKAGSYLAPDDSFRVAVPGELGNGRWMREYYHVTEQLEVQFGDDQCRRYYLKKFGGAVGKAIAEDYAARGGEATLRSAVAQLAAQRREDIASVSVRAAKYGTAVVATTMSKRGWPCVKQFPEGGSTVSVAWYFVHEGALYEAGYQAALSPGEDAGPLQANAAQRADALASGMEMLDTATKPRFPFTASDPPPRLAGLTLGDTRAAVERVVGPVLEHEDGSWEFKDEKRGLYVQGSNEKGVELLGITRREDGEVAGVRVGDRIADVMAKWGPPASGGTIEPQVVRLGYSAGSWDISVWVVKDRFSYLTLYRAAHAASEESVSEVWPAALAPKAPPDIHRVAKLPAESDIHLGQCYELPAGLLENYSGDSVHQNDPNVGVSIADVVASPPALPGSAAAVDALKRLLASGPVTLEIVGVYTMGDGARMIDARVSAGDQDAASTMVRDGWAIAVKGRNSDLALLSLEAQARAANRGLWGLGPAELEGSTPEVYLHRWLGIAIVPESYRKSAAQ